MNKPTARDFIPNINTANEEIERLDARIAELEGQLAAKPDTTPKVEALKAQAAAPSVGATQLTGVHRAIHAVTKK